MTLIEACTEKPNKLTLKSLNDKVVEQQTQIDSLLTMIEDLQEQVESKRGGPKSERAMTEDDARRILDGDMKDVGHKQAANDLQLSYGQVYSCRKGFTFKKIHQEIKKAE